ncbi:MAG: hypothetical protein R2749_31665 [Acidimicrobiales bacterium]
MSAIGCTTSTVDEHAAGGAPVPTGIPDDVLGRVLQRRRGRPPAATCSRGR